MRGYYVTVMSQFLRREIAIVDFRGAHVWLNFISLRCRSLARRMRARECECFAVCHNLVLSRETFAAFLCAAFVSKINLLKTSGP